MIGSDRKNRPPDHLISSLEAMMSLDSVINSAKFDGRMEGRIEGRKEGREEERQKNAKERLESA